MILMQACNRQPLESLLRKGVLYLALLKDAPELNHLYVMHRLSYSVEISRVRPSGHRSEYPPVALCLITIG